MSKQIAGLLEGPVASGAGGAENRRRCFGNQAFCSRAVHPHLPKGQVWLLPASNGSGSWSTTTIGSDAVARCSALSCAVRQPRVLALAAGFGVEQLERCDHRRLPHRRAVTGEDTAFGAAWPVAPRQAE